jgi:hypothetical protein
MKKIFILSSLVISALIIEAQAPTQPNFVLIIADDLNDYVQGFDGHPQAKTPNIAKIAKKGTTFHECVLCWTEMCTEQNKFNYR